MPAGVGGGFNHHLIGTLATPGHRSSYVTGAHNMKFGYQGGFSNPSQTYTYFNEIIHVRMNNGVPNRLTQTIVDSTSANPKYRPQPPADLVLRAGSVDHRPVDAAGRHSVRLPAHHLSRVEDWRPRLHGSRPAGNRVSLAVDPGDPLARRHRPLGRGLRRVRQRQDGRQVQHGQVHGSLRGEQLGLRPQSADSHDHQHDAGVDRLEQGFRARTAICRTPRRTANAGR